MLYIDCRAVTTNIAISRGVLEGAQYDAPEQYCQNEYKNLKKQNKGNFDKKYESILIAF